MEELELVEDAAFDALYPAAIRAVSSLFWTPVAVARRAARLLRQGGAHNVLDVGSGVGKFVLVAASETPELHFVGVEQRERLVDVARQAQARLGISNASFRTADVTEMPWLEFDGLYLFNPLEENLFSDTRRIDDAVELTEKRFHRDRLRFEAALRRAPLGMTIVTYHGMGAHMPACYELTDTERAGSDRLQLWVKKREDSGGYILEPGKHVVMHGRGCAVTGAGTLPYRRR